MTPEILGAVLLALAALTGLLKAATTYINKKVQQVDTKGDATRENLEARITKAETRLDGHDESLRAGNERFNKTDAKLEEMQRSSDAKLDRLNEKQDAQNSKLDQLIGFVWRSAAEKTGGKYGCKSSNGGI